MPKSSRDMIKMIEKDGWYHVKTVGSHHFKHPVKQGKVTVPHPKKELTRKTEQTILLQEGIQQI